MNSRDIELNELKHQSTKNRLNNTMQDKEISILDYEEDEKSENESSLEHSFIST